MGVGNQQIIRGSQYTQYTPPWYAAMDADKIHTASVNGQAAGVETAAALGGISSFVGGQANGAASSAPPTVPMPSMSGQGSSAGSSPASSGGGAAPSAGGAPAPVTYDTQAAEAASAAAFGRAKDQAGSTARAALQSLQGELERSGMGGGGYEAGRIGKTLSTEANTIGEASRAQAESDAARGQHVADENYQGGIAQRGQDISVRGQDLAHDEAGRSLAERSAEAGYSGAISQRGQDISAAEAEKARQLQYLQLALGGIKSLY